MWTLNPSLRASYAHPYAMRPAPTIRILIRITYLKYSRHQRDRKEYNDHNMCIVLVPRLQGVLSWKEHLSDKGLYKPHSRNTDHRQRRTRVSPWWFHWTSPYLFFVILKCVLQIRKLHKKIFYLFCTMKRDIIHRPPNFHWREIKHVNKTTKQKEKTKTTKSNRRLSRKVYIIIVKK